MKKEVIFAVTLSVLATTAMPVPDASSKFTVQPGPVGVKQGNSVTLWCQVELDTSNVVPVPVHWQSPPDFRTRTSMCVSYERQKYRISCGDMWYNMTIKDVQWADRGKYRCIHIQHMGIVDLKVLVPVRDVSLTYVSNSTSKPLPLVLSKGVDAVLTCTTDCAYPAPKISWFENGQPFKDSATVTTTELVCSGDKEGQMQTMSTITVRGEYVERERKNSTISCEAGNIIGEEMMSKAIVVTYDADPCESVRCPPGRVCQGTSKNPGVCMCGPPDFCDGHNKQVCGDDGILYPSHCELHRTACIKDEHIRVDHTNNTCEPIVTPQPISSKGGHVAAWIASFFALLAIVLIAIVVVLHRKNKKELHPDRMMIQKELEQNLVKSELSRTSCLQF